MIKGGHRFTHDKVYRLKSEANKRAKFHRRAGYLARITKVSGGYQVWFGTKRIV